MTDQVYYQARIQRIISVRVVREPDQCTGRQDIRKNSVDLINELIDQVNRAAPGYIAKDLINTYICAYIINCELLEFK